MNVLPSTAVEILAKTPRDPKLYGKVGVLMGGYAEYDVSLKTGSEVLNALQNAGVDAHKVLVRSDNNWYRDLLSANYDRVFIALHGKVGEDGTVQAALEMAAIPYTGSKVCASVLAMHKLRTKQIWQAIGLPTLPYAEIKEGFNVEEIIQKFGLPLAVKASAAGSTFGISKVKSAEELPAAFALARQYDDTVIVEPWLENNTEYTVPVLDKYALPSIRIVPKQEFFDYEAKYIDDDTGFFCPSGLSETEENELRNLSEQAYQSLGCTTMGRVDVLRDQNGKFWLVEVNTIPGLTTHSTTPRAVQALGYTFTDFVMTVLAMTL
ncbi:MAG: D-alanine--D-alanine ligase [Gammaproteobacteria bacterium]